MEKIKIYTDGACKGNPGPGGWGAVLIYNDQEKHIFGSEKNTTNNQMELKAPIEALLMLKDANNYEIEIYTDSIYVKNGITIWIHNWIKSDWKLSNKAPVKNKDLWQKLYDLTKRANITWHWVRGHNGDKYNELADMLANKGLK